MDKIRLLRSDDVKHGSPQYFIHKKDPDSPHKSASGHWEPYSRSPDVSRITSQHLIVYRGQDPKPLPQSDPRFRCSGQVFVQDAFDQMGKLRLGNDGAIFNEPGARVKSWPVQESDGSIYVYFGEDKDGVQQLGDAMHYDRGVMMPTIGKGRDNLATKMTGGARSILDEALKKDIAEIEQRRKEAAAKRAAMALSSPLRVGAAAGVDGSAYGQQQQQRQHKAWQTPVKTPAKKGGDAEPEQGWSGKIDERYAPITGATDGLDSPQDTARSSWATARSNVSGVDEMLAEVEMEAMKHKAGQMAMRKSVVNEIGDGEMAAIFMTEKLRQEEQLRLEEEKKQLKLEIRGAKEALRAHKTVYVKKQEEVDKCEKDKQQAMLDLVPIFDQAEPLRRELMEDKRKVEVQKIMLNKYKKEHGEKGLFSTLKRELYEQRAHMHDLELALQELEPREKAKRKQISDRDAKLIVAQRVLRKANDRTLALESRLDAVNAAMEEHRVKLLNTDPNEVLLHVSEESNRYMKLGRIKSMTNLMEKMPENAKDDVNDDEDPGWEYAGRPHAKGEDAENYKVFTSPHAIFRRACLVARAKSPRWRDKLQGDMARYAMYAPAIVKPPEWIDALPPPFDDVWRVRPTYFDCKIRVPTKLAMLFEIFCRSPPHPFEPCTHYEVLTETTAGKCVNIRFNKEPGGYLLKLLQMFRKPEFSGKGLDMYLDQMSVMAQEKREVAQHTSLRERWAAEGLCFDTDADMASMGVKKRSQETWQERYEMTVQDNEFSNAPAVPHASVDTMVLWNVPVFKDARVDFLKEVEKIVEVIELPAAKRLIDQGTVSDCMYIIEKGILLCHIVTCSQENARADDVKLDYTIPEDEMTSTPSHRDARNKWPRNSSGSYTASFSGKGGLRMSKAVASLGPGQCINAQGLLEGVPLDYSYESVDPCRLYRIRRGDYLKILPQFPGQYEKLFKLSYKRATEWSGKSIVSGFAARSAAASGIAFTELGRLKGTVKGRKSLDEFRSADIFADKSKAKTLFMDDFMKGKTGDEVYEARVACKKHPEVPPGKTFMEQIMEERAHKEAIEAAEEAASAPPERPLLGEMNHKTVAWRNNGLNVATESSKSLRVVHERDIRCGDWWRDSAPELSTGATALASNFEEKAAAMETRVGANVWRVAALKYQGIAMLDKIK